MSNNLKNIALGVLGLLVLVLFGAFVNVSTESSQGGEVGRYVPVDDDDPDGWRLRILDTKTGRLYFVREAGQMYYMEGVKGAKPSED